ncbi:MAG: thioesterase family protein [Actinomycetota bacterium]
MTHRLSLRPRFAEMDPYGHVNHAVYLAWFEEARVRALEDAGLGLDHLAETGFQIVITDVRLRYRRAVTASDEVVVESRVASTGRASSVWAQRAVVEGQVCVEGELKGGITDRTGRPTRPPAGFFDQLGPLVAADWD